MLVSLYLWRDVVGNMRYNGRRYAYNGCTNGKIRWHTSSCNRRWVVRLADSVEYRMEIIGCTHTSSMPHLCFNRGHSAVVDARGAATLLGMPLDFRNTLRHINTRGQWPAAQRAMMWLTRMAFARDAAPAVFDPPPGDPFVTVNASVSSLSGKRDYTHIH